MRIDHIGFNNKISSNNLHSSKKMNCASFIVQKDSFTPSVSFKGNHDDKTMKKLKDLHCPCCGVKMLAEEDLKKLSKDKRIEGPSKDAIEALEPYQEHMRKNEKLVFRTLKKESEKYPDKKLSELLQGEVLENPLSQLKLIESHVFNRIEDVSEGLTDSKALVKQAVEEAREIISQDKEDYQFKRKTFIKKLNDIEPSKSEKATHNIICEIAQKLPQANNNYNAFMVKYAGRSSSEIAMSLIKMSVGTVEHVKPETSGGQSRLSNYILECGGCNHPRGSIPLDEWIKKSHPKMPENTQIYMDEIIEKLNNGEIPEFSDYPPKIKKSLEKESKGLIRLDTSKWKDNSYEEMNDALSKLKDKFKKD